MDIVMVIRIRIRIVVILVEVTNYHPVVGNNLLSQGKEDYNLEGVVELGV